MVNKKIIIHFDKNSIMIEKVPSQGNISSATPQTNFIMSHKKDISKEIGALKKLSKKIHDKKKILDIMAGCGFSAKIFLSYLNPSFLQLNDMDISCIHVLKNNFNDLKITQKNALDFSFQEYFDLTFIDFNSFTINHIDKWKKLIHAVSNNSKELLVTDSASYGFTRFPQNSKSYKVTNYEEYCDKFKSIFLNFGFCLKYVINFGNAALFYMDRNAKNWKLLSFTPIPITFESEGKLW